jgi:hypothetical protein
MLWNGPHLEGIILRYLKMEGQILEGQILDAEKH